jgi:streptogramin lyase
VPGVGRVVAKIDIGSPAKQYPAIASNGIWLPLEDVGELIRVDPAGNQVIDTVMAGKPAQAFPPFDPSAVAVNGDQVWVTLRAEKAVGRIDLQTKTITDKIDIGFQPFALAFDGDVLWVTASSHNFEQSAVVRVDTKTKKVIAIVKGVEGAPTGVVVGAGAIWVAEHQTGNLDRIDSTTNLIVTKIPLSSTLENIAFGEGSVWTANNDGHSISRIDPATNSEVARIDIGAPALAVAVGDGMVWAAGYTEGCNSKNSFLVRIDPSTNQVMGTMPVVCPFAIAISAQAVWVGDYRREPSIGLRGGFLYRIEPAK